jgi:hypothetical protein
VSDLTRLRIAVEDLEMVSDALTGRARDTAAVPVASNDRAEVARRLELADRIGRVADSLIDALYSLTVVDEPLVVVDGEPPAGPEHDLTDDCPACVVIPCAAVLPGSDRG